MLKRIWTHSMFMLVRMAAVVLVLEVGYDVYNGVPIFWRNELTNVLIFVVLFWVVYALAVAMDFRRMRSSPFLVAEAVCRQIARKIAVYRTFEGRQGLFHAAGDQQPVANPAELIERFEAYIDVLFTVDNGEAERLIADIRKLQREAEQMAGRIGEPARLVPVSEASG